MWIDIKEQLDRVSRSFAVCIPMLEKGLREIVGLAYILLRVLDSIEDSLLDKKTKARLFAKFLELLTHAKSDQADYQQFRDQEWKGLSQDERELLKSDKMERMIGYYWQLDQPYQKLIRVCVQEMMFGMQKFVSNNSNIFVEFLDQKKALKTRSLYNEYCYYVAGTVGVLLTEICIKFYSSQLTFGKKLRSMTLAFGRLLQKVNIVKDCREDLKRGLCFLPEEFIKVGKEKKSIEKLYFSLVFKEMKQDFLLAKDYIFKLPDNFLNFKKFCLLALLPAYKTLEFIKVNNDRFSDDNFLFKIPRTDMFECINLASDLDKSHLAIKRLHLKLYQTTSN